jgi:HK97 gp10 family phage protein
VSFGVVINGLDKFTKNLDQLKDTTKIKQAVLAGALMVEKSAKESIAHGSKSGVLYVRHGIAHKASAPGEAPATDIGTLISSIQHWVSDDGLSIAVGTQLEYGTYLEFGTRDMAERPFIHPALDINKQAILERIKKAAGTKQ